MQCPFSPCTSSTNFVNYTLNPCDVSDRGGGYVCFGDPEKLVEDNAHLLTNAAISVTTQSPVPSPDTSAISTRARAPSFSEAP